MTIFQLHQWCEKVISQTTEPNSVDVFFLDDDNKLKTVIDEDSPTDIKEFDGVGRKRKCVILREFRF